jgi:hypothetical protein
MEKLNGDVILYHGKTFIEVYDTPIIREKDSVNESEDIVFNTIFEYSKALIDKTVIFNDIEYRVKNVKVMKKFGGCVESIMFEVEK